MKDDLRSRLSRRILKDALLEILSYKRSYDISVKELCDKAGINRSTFYRHYNNIADVLEEIENDLIAMITDVNTASVNDPDNSWSYIYNTLSFLETHHEYDPLFLTDFSAFYDLIRKLESTVSGSIRALTKKSEKEVSYLMKFLLSGTFSIIYDWIRGGRKEGLGSVLLPDDQRDIHEVRRRFGRGQDPEDHTETHRFLTDRKAPQGHGDHGDSGRSRRTLEGITEDKEIKQSVDRFI